MRTLLRFVVSLWVAVAGGFRVNAGAAIRTLVTFLRWRLGARHGHRQIDYVVRRILRWDR